jgi:nucleotidyltransferase substrate binding protein (TIGR01987 family)
LNDKLESLTADLRSALDRLDDVLRQPFDEYIRDSAIQRFEFTFEMFWKTLKARCTVDGLVVHSPREAVRGAFKLGLLPDDGVALGMLEDRNRASHTYNAETAEHIYSRLEAYTRLMRDTMESVERT